MNKSIKRAGLAAVIVASGFSFALNTSSVSASTAGGSTFPERDDVQVDEEVYFIGGDGFTNGAPDNPAVLTWHHSSTFGTAAKLDGKIHFDDAVNCARVVLVALTYDGVEIADGRTTSDEVCPATTGHHARNIVEDGVGPLAAKFGADKVKVILQTEPRPGDWVNAGSQTVTFGPNLDTDSAQIKRAEYDLGRGPFSAGSPTESASVEWVAEDTGKISARTNGTLYAKNADDSCVQMEFRYKTAEGVIIETRQGVEHCLETDDLTTFPVSATNFSHYALRQVTLAIMKDGVQLGSTTVELGDPQIIDPSIPTLP